MRKPIMNIIKPPLAIHFVWHPNDHNQYYPNISKFRQYLTRDIDRPFSRELNIPTFLYSSRNHQIVPRELQKIAQKDLVFLFLSRHTLINKEWVNYINDISSDFIIIPLALDDNALKHTNSGRLKNLNLIRSYTWPLKNQEEYFILMLSHEIYRFSFLDDIEGNKGNDSSLKLFLSHTKVDEHGVNLASEIKKFIDNTNIQNFFDTTDIAPSHRFDEEIEQHLQESTVIAIGSDKYSSRYWCQREILLAKEERRPIIFVNTLEYYEDRIFPAITNIPNIHISHNLELREKEILRILIAALLETVRFNYATNLLEYYRAQEWIDPKSEIFARPPEINQIIKLLKEREKSGKSNEVLHVCYPEPPVYAEEISWINQFEKPTTQDDIFENKIEAVTPLWSVFKKKHTPNKIGISISDYKQDQFEKHNQHIDELKRLAQVLAAHLLAHEHTLIYGGDLRKDGFTQFILDEAMIIQSRLKDSNIRVENHLAWPLYLDEKVDDFEVEYYSLVEIVKHEIPTDISVDETIFIPPTSPENKYIWSRCLSEMRLKSIEQSDIRILAGGKCEGYLGKMPGVLEELIITIEQKKPVYLLGGFGGITHKITQSILNESIEKELTERWQIENNEGYADLQQIAKQNGVSAEYDEIKDLILKLDINLLAEKTGLTLEQYQRLMITPFIDEAAHLILEGLVSLSCTK